MRRRLLQRHRPLGFAHCLDRIPCVASGATLFGEPATGAPELDRGGVGASGMRAEETHSRCSRRLTRRWLRD